MFYDNIKFSLLILPVVVPYIRNYKKKAIIKRKEKLLTEFRFALDFITTGVLAGLSVERAFGESCKSLKEMFGKDAYICKELSLIMNKISLGETIESGVKEFAQRTHIRELYDFAEVFEISKRTGADMTKIIKNTSEVIVDKIFLKEEVLTMTTSKRFEAKVMKVMPLVIIGYLRWGADNYFKNLYHNSFGILVMTLAIICYVLASCWLDKIADIGGGEV
ncbi:MAG: type II secretion system F family protein [Lachnospiraceae bacterium]|nr:type II secretion system F family protein [Lachnospiraceae bacterium]